MRAARNIGRPRSLGADVGEGTNARYLDKPILQNHSSGRIS